MTPVQAMHEAEVEVAIAALATRTALRPLARKSAAQQARAAEDRYIAARLEVWGMILPAARGRSAPEGATNIEGGN